MPQTKTDHIANVGKMVNRHRGHSRALYGDLCQNGKLYYTYPKTLLDERSDPKFAKIIII